MSCDDRSAGVFRSGDRVRLIAPVPTMDKAGRLRPDKLWEAVAAYFDSSVVYTVGRSFRRGADVWVMLREEVRWSLREDWLVAVEGAPSAD